MSRRHRAPVLVFVAMAVVCTVVLAYSIRGSAADGVPLADPGLGFTTSSGQTLVREPLSVVRSPADVVASTTAPDRSQLSALLPRAAVDYARAATHDKSDRPGRGLGRSSSTHPGRGHGLDKSHPGKGHAHGKSKARGHSRAGHQHGKARGHSKARHGKAKGHGKRGWGKRHRRR